MGCGSSTYAAHDLNPAIHFDRPRHLETENSHAVQASVAEKQYSKLEGRFHAEPRMTEKVQAKENRMLMTDMKSMLAEPDFLTPAPISELFFFFSAQIDSLDSLLTETELIIQRIATSYLALSSSFKYSHTLVDNTLRHRILWAKDFHLECILAMDLKPGTAMDGLNGVKNMTEQDMVEACECFSIKVKDTLLSGLMRLKSTQSQSGKNHADFFKSKPGVMTRHEC
jgi:hypothetical protein